MSEAVHIRAIRPSDREAAQALLEDALGEGFGDLGDIEDTGVSSCSFIALDGDEPAGVLSAKVRPAVEALPAGTWGDGPAKGDQERPASGAGRTPVEPSALVLHLRDLAVDPAHRRTGIASRLLRRAEEAGRARGASLAVVYAWLPFGQPAPASVPLYQSAGYEAFVDLPDFFAAMSVETGAVCPFCGPPPCRCSARILTKSLTPGTGRGRPAAG